jgi:hypothetical protein
VTAISCTANLSGPFVVSVAQIKAIGSAKCNAQLSLTLKLCLYQQGGSPVCTIKTVSTPGEGGSTPFVTASLFCIKKEEVIEDIHAWFRGEINNNTIPRG